MNTGLEWRTARRDDRVLLQSFTCTVDRPSDWREAHPRPWELEVQSYVRGLKPPLREDRVVRLGLSESQLAGIVIVERLGDPFVHIPIIARALGRRGTAVGAAILEHALDTAASLVAPESERVIVSANIHRRNVASQRCFERAGFTRDTERIDDDYEQWLLQMDIEL